jgi:hypothetical protein
MEPHEPKEVLESGRQPLRPWSKFLALALASLALFLTFARDAAHLKEYNDALNSYLGQFSPGKLISLLEEEEGHVISMLSCSWRVRSIFSYSQFLSPFQNVRKTHPSLRRVSCRSPIVFCRCRMVPVGHAQSGRTQFYRGLMYTVLWAGL